MHYSDQWLLLFIHHFSFHISVNDLLSVQLLALDLLLKKIFLQDNHIFLFIDHARKCLMLYSELNSGEYNREKSLEYSECSIVFLNPWFLLTSSSSRLMRVGIIVIIPTALILKAFWFILRSAICVWSITRYCCCRIVLLCAVFIFSSLVSVEIEERISLISKIIEKGLNRVKTIFHAQKYFEKKLIFVWKALLSKYS